MATPKTTQNPTPEPATPHTVNTTPLNELTPTQVDPLIRRLLTAHADHQALTTAKFSSFV